MLAHLRLLVLPLLGDRDSSDGDLARHDGVDGPGKGELHRASDLAAVVVTDREHSPEQAHVVVATAHLLATLVVCLLAVLHRVLVHRRGRRKLGVQGNPAVAHEDAEAGGLRPPWSEVQIGTVWRLRQIDKVADLALQADVGDDALECLGVHPWEVARVRVAVGVAVGHVEQDEEIVTLGRVGDASRDVHSVSSLELWSSAAARARRALFSLAAAMSAAR